MAWVTLAAMAVAFSTLIWGAVESQRWFHRAYTAPFLVCAGVLLGRLIPQALLVAGVITDRDRTAFSVAYDPVVYFAGAWTLLPAVHMARCRARRRIRADHPVYPEENGG